MPDLSRVSPLAGLGRLFSKQQLFETAKLVLMTVVTQAEFRGYASSSDNSEMLLHLLEDLKDFSKFCHLQQDKQDKQPKLFEDLPCVCTSRKREPRKNSAAFSDVSLPTEQNTDNFS